MALPHRLAQKRSSYFDRRRPRALRSSGDSEISWWAGFRRPTRERRRAASSWPRRTKFACRAPNPKNAEAFCYAEHVEGSELDDRAFFTAITKSGVRALLIGRKALIVLGMPVLTADYDFWVHIDDIEAFNQAVAPFDLVPSHSPADARKRSRYVLENDERVDVLIARAQTTKGGVRLTFDEAWRDRVQMESDGAKLFIPSLAHLIMTKQWSMRVHDLDDIRFIEGLRSLEKKT